MNLWWHISLFSSFLGGLWNHRSRKAEWKHLWVMAASALHTKLKLPRGTLFLEKISSTEEDSAPFQSCTKNQKYGLCPDPQKDLEMMMLKFLNFFFIWWLLCQNLLAWVKHPTSPVREINRARKNAACWNPTFLQPWSSYLLKLAFTLKSAVLRQLVWSWSTSFLPRRSTELCETS